MKVETIIIGLALFASSCHQNINKSDSNTPPEAELTSYGAIIVDSLNIDNTFEIDIPVTGRYSINISTNGSDTSFLWVEDYIENVDNRKYNISGNIYFNESGDGEIFGSPLAKGTHRMRLHFSNKYIHLDKLKFQLMYEHQPTPDTLIQNMDGQKWDLVWSDEFEKDGGVDIDKWSFNVGNWGWGNNELQFYTDNKKQNARVENGNLIIEANKIKDSKYWNSARLTTQGKVSFLYGKIEFRAKVPCGRGTWSAGWLLGDEYRDEISWPYCGEIDVLECVGYEIDDSTGNGKNHGSCHTRAYYFKQNNHITGEIEMENMHDAFHTYTVEWYPNKIEAFLDGKHYYTYDKIANRNEWPFYKPHNIIINLAIGGGWGGLKGLDSSFTSHQYILDYVRVYRRI